MRLLLGLGIGAVTRTAAQNLLDHFGSLAAVADATLQELQDCARCLIEGGARRLGIF